MSCWNKNYLKKKEDVSGPQNMLCAYIIKLYDYHIAPQICEVWQMPDWIECSYYN